MEIFEKVKQSTNIAEVVESFGVKLNYHDKGLCPFHREKTPSFSIDRSKNIFTCFGCGETGDVITFVSRMKGLEPLDAAKRLAETYHIDIEDGKKKTKSSSIKEYIKRCQANVGKTDYFLKRGLTATTIQKFCLGYDESRKAVVIPYSGKLAYYQTRGVANKVFFKPKTEDAGAEPLFNIEGMKLRSKEPVFVVESPICAMSIYQCGGNAVSTCGTSGWRNVVDEVKKRKPNGGFILCMDNDDPGRTASKTLQTALLELEVHVMEYNVAGEKKDPNELLMENPSLLESNIREAKLALKKKYRSAKDSFSAEELCAENVTTPQWIVQDVLPVGLAMLCAPSKIGKSWMMLQLGLAVSQGKDFMDFKTNKCGVLYYALEDSRYRLKDRMTKMLKGGKPSRDLHFAIQADIIDNGFLDKLGEELQNAPEIKLVIIDTLQKVRGRAIKSESAYSNDYREMAKLKAFADKNNVCLLFVHHLRKMTDEHDVFNMISGSTGIMGAADSIFIISKKKRDDESAILSMTGRDIRQKSLSINFDNGMYQWVVQGTEEEMAYRRQRADYINHPIILTIKELIKRSPIGTWRGSAVDLMKAVYDFTGKQLAESSTSVGKFIAKYEYELHCDGIDHAYSKSGKRCHSFTKATGNMKEYQGHLFDGETRNPTNPL